MMEMQKVINNICTIGSVLLLMGKTCQDCIINEMEFTESFLSDPWGYIFTLVPIIFNTFILLLRFFNDAFELGGIVIFLYISAIVLIGIIAEFVVIKKYTLYDNPVISGDIGKWYTGIVIVVLIIFVEGILTGDVDSMLDGLPYQYCLFCFFLALQKAIITYPYLFETFNIEYILGLIFLLIKYWLGYFFCIPLGVFLLWLLILFNK